MLVKLENASLAFGHHPLLDHAKLSIDAGERVCLIGRNGTGKSSLMKVIIDELQLDEGNVWRKDGVRISRLQQDVPRNDERTVFDVVVAGLGEVSSLIADYHSVIKQLETEYSDAILKKLERLQHELEAHNGWSAQQRVEAIMSKLALPVDKRVSELSGGWRRRVLLAQALASDPDLLLLDEPTNHLDIEAITWLEQFLLTQHIGILFVTHDRAFLRKLATRIIELDRGILTSWPGDYDNYLRRKEEALATEEQENALFDKRLAQEEVWIRKGIKARRTRNEGRVRRLEALRRERAERRELGGKVKMNVAEGESSGKLVFEAEDVSFAWDKQPLFQHFSTRIMRGDRIGLIGPNGSGKSSLLKILLGEVEPTLGKVRQGTNLQIAYFDQQRAELDPQKSVIDSVSNGNDRVTVDGKSRHIVGYLKDFLFDPERLNSPVSTLSGGESNRLMLAKMFTQPANVLVLDEPTNDLDMDTLDLLEELLAEFKGTILLVSHDRDFLDQIVTSTIVFEGDGEVREYVGGYSDYLRQRDVNVASEARTLATGDSKHIQGPKEATGKPATKLSYKETRELEALPATIEGLEEEQGRLQAISGDPSFYKQEQSGIAETLRHLEEIATELEKSYLRWDELEAKSKS